MIAFVQGRFVRKTPTVVYVLAHGVGYELQVSLHTYSAIQSLEEGLLYTYLHVREDAMLLYGFATEDEKELFTQLLTVSGIGTSTARMMLSAARPDELRMAIAGADTRLLESVKGIGKKTAERLVVELRDKMKKAGVEAAHPADLNTTGNTLEQDALQALLALGIPKNNAENALRKVTKEGTHEDLETLIKLALKSL